MNEYYYPKIAQPWMNVVLPRWPDDIITDEQTYLKVDAQFKLKNNENKYIFDGILYVKTEYIAYYHDIDTNNIDCLDKCLNMKFLELIQHIDR